MNRKVVAETLALIALLIIMAVFDISARQSCEMSLFAAGLIFVVFMVFVNLILYALDGPNNKIAKRMGLEEEKISGIIRLSWILLLLAGLVLILFVPKASPNCEQWQLLSNFWILIFLVVTLGWEVTRRFARWLGKKARNE